MEITPRTRLMLKAQNLSTIVLFLSAVGLLAWLSSRYTFELDWTHGRRHTLSAASREVVAALPGEVSITTFIRPDSAIEEHVRRVVERYQRYKPDIQLVVVNPDTDPQRVRTLGVSREGALHIEYDASSVTLESLDEQALTNALLRLARREERWVAFLSGHGERRPLGEANHDLGLFGEDLQRKGFAVRELNLSVTPGVPDNASVLVVAGPQVDLLPGEVEIIRAYVAGGGNLLWLADTDGLRGMQPLGEDLGVRFLPGMIVDATTQALGIDDPAFALVTEYPSHPIVRNFLVLTLYPQTLALEVQPQGEWQASEFLRTLERAWTETGPVSGRIRFDEDAGERRGPLTIGVALSRQHSAADADQKTALSGEQRVIVVGDGDFLSNAYLGNGGNLDLGLRMLNWLSRDDRFIEIPARTAPDTALELSESQMAVIGLGFLFGVPGLLFLSGLLIWRVRQRR